MSFDHWQIPQTSCRFGACLDHGKIFFILARWFEWRLRAKRELSSKSIYVVVIVT
jgi:hypothetical protein